MTPQQKQLLLSKEYCIVMSQYTTHIYIDNNACCYVYDTKDEAESFCGDDGALKPTSPTRLVLSQFLTTCHNTGIKTIKVKHIHKERYIDVPIEASDIPKGFYNPVGNRSINRLKHTGKKPYLRELENVDYIAPIVIIKRKEGEYPKVHYGYASSADGTRYMILFTTTYAFDKWREKQTEAYLPMKTVFKDFVATVGRTALLINPLTDNLFLTKEQAAQIHKK